jgi:hypothetical protein
MLIHYTDFERVSGLFFGATWTQISPDIPAMVTRHGQAKSFQTSLLPQARPTLIEHTTMSDSQWYFQNYCPNPRYHFAGWAKLVNLVYFGLPYGWGELLIPFPWFLALVARPGEILPEYMPDENRLGFWHTPAKSFLLQYADATGVWTGQIPVTFQDQMFCMLNALEADPGSNPEYPKLDVPHDVGTLLDDSILVTSPYIMI